MSSDAPPPLESAVESLIDLGATLSQLVAHMTAYRDRPGGPAAVRSESIADVLAPLLVETLREAADRLGPERMAAAATFLREAAETIPREILLYDPPPPNRAARRRQRC